MTLSVRHRDTDQQDARQGPHYRRTCQHGSSAGESLSGLRGGLGGCINVDALWMLCEWMPPYQEAKSLVADAIFKSFVR
jgi:hypothetical protein